MQRMRRAGGRLAAAAATFATIAVLATACGQDREPDQELDTMREFAACMRDQGLAFPDPVREEDGGISSPAGPIDGDWDAFEAARRICEAETGHRMD